MSAPTPKEIREAFTDYRSEWKDIYDEGETDMQAISPEGPWTEADRKTREDAGRPCIHLDQINQYLNQTIGNARKNKRAVKAIPKGNGASDKDANHRSTVIMGIEERSSAQQIYLYSFECMLQRSFGFALLRTEYRDDSSFDQEILIKPVQNPDTILISPHYKQPDASDIPEGFVIDRIPRAKYKEKYKDAKITDFSGEIMGGQHVSDWISDKTVQIAEYWKVEHDVTTLLLVQPPPIAGQAAGAPIIITKDEWEKAGKIGRVLRDRRVEKPRVVQYMTNGLEILDEIPWAGTRIPIISCLGPERWRSDGGQTKRQLFSMVRFARDPQMLYDFLATQECELAGMVPKTPYVGAKGQFASASETWEEITKVPHPYVEYDVIIDGVTQQALPPPQRLNFDAPFQEYEAAKDAAGRSLQASMGISALPTAAARRNEKSGVALERIDDMESLGSFHFVDRYENCFLYNMGWQINELITPIIDTPRDMPVSQPDGKRGLMHLVGNTSHPLDDQGAYNVQDLPEEHFHTGKGEFDVTISTGPSYQSEREEQSAFVDQLIENMPNMPAPGTPPAKVLALAIRMRADLGPIGEQIADVFDPPDPSNFPPAAQASITQLQGQVTQLTQENQALHMDRAGRVLEQQTKLQLEQMKGAVAKYGKALDYITKIVTAQLAKQSKADQTQAQVDAQRELAELGFHHDQIDRAHDAAHELAMRESAPPPIPDPAQSQPTSST